MAHDPTHTLTPAELLRNARVKVTRGRELVLGLLLNAHQPLSHADIEAQCASQEAAAPDRVTLYRILETLVGCGLALKAVDTRGVFRFSGATTRHRHDSHVHFRCTDCGGMYCLEASPPAPPALPAGFQLSSVTFDVSGVCGDCRRLAS